MKEQATGKYDSEFCGSLPIHLINMIQPYGAVMVVDSQTLNIVQTSVNVDQITGTEANEVVSTSILDYLDSDSISAFNTRCASGDNTKTPFLLRVCDKNFLVILHTGPKHHILEINFDSANEIRKNVFIDVYQDLKPAIAAIESAQSLEEAAAVTTFELKRASGFDKVMIYQFDPEWNGNVLAEAKEEDMESYMGFTFPASDIPKQARDLYFKNAYRFIPDRNYAPVKLYPVMNPLTQSFIDMSDCNLRGVSAVHIEYLKNMNVVASMSTRILEGNKLWGLIACHHKTAKEMSYKVCATFELLSGIISAKIASLSNTSNLVISSRLKTEFSVMLEEVYRSGKVDETILKGTPNVLDLFEAGGAVITVKNNYLKTGDVPDDHELDDLLLWLNAKNVTEVYSTNILSEQFDNASNYREMGSGLLVIPLNSDEDEYLLLFRPERIQVNNWGGDPSTRINFESDMKTYHPRFSFKLWREQVTGISKPWRKEETELARNMKKFLADFKAQRQNNRSQNSN